MRIKHTYVIDNPFEGKAVQFGLTEEQVEEPSKSPSQCADFEEDLDFLDDDGLDIEKTAKDKTLQ